MNKELFIFIAIIFLIGTGFVLATAPNWQGTETNYTINEDTTYNHNLTLNITGYNNDVNFSIDSFAQNPIYWTNSSGRNPVNENSLLLWILMKSGGNLTFNATYDNQTGFFEIPIQATNTTGTPSATVEYLEFMINATNDAPVFTNINTTYNLTQNIQLQAYVNATDEEQHYSEFFNITFINNCTLAGWSTRTNCSLLTLVNSSNTSALMNFTPERNDVGTYWANITVMDNGENYLCPHQFCDNATYQQNKTTYKMVQLSVFSSLVVNVTDCQNKIFQENITNTCQINISTKGETDSMNLSSRASLRNYAGSIVNTSWFYANSTQLAVDFIKTITVNVTPSKTEVGNWTINFTVVDTTSGENLTTPIYIYVNRTYNDVPEFTSLNNVNTSINLATTINLEVFDDDLLIPDKNSSYGGFNETTNFRVYIFNRTNLSQTLTINNFNVNILNMPVAGTNKTTARILFTPNSSESGNYTINITVNDSENALVYNTFNMTILNNTAPNWTGLLQTTFVSNESDSINLNLSLNSTDSDGDTLTFSYTNDTTFPSFSLNSTTGILSFTSVDADVGQHIVSITISDGYLTSSQSFNFTIYNVNDNPSASSFTSNTPYSTYNSTHVMTAEDNETIIYANIIDNDFRIPAGQKSFYNESLTVTTTILNSTGQQANLFNFTLTIPPTDNLLIYQASFTPNKTDVGNYQVVMNITDLSNASTTLNFNLTIAEIQHSPTLDSLTNQTLKINSTLSYKINATDLEDGNESTGNLTFIIEFLEGNNFINGNQTIFNTTSGQLNITFNDSQSGTYHLNVTVNDTSGRNSSQEFWIFVYGLPNVTFPLNTFNFTLQENVTSSLIFKVNHTLQDNLTCKFYLNDVLRYNTSCYGNNANFTWNFTPNFTDETNNEYQNLTLVAINPTFNELNVTQNWNVNITYTNSPLTFSASIGSFNGGSPQVITLSNYFTDLDAVDQNQTIAFTSSASNLTGGTITISTIDWINGTTPTMTFSATANSGGVYSITANEYNRSNSSQIINSVTSNNFSVDLTITTTPTPVSTPVSGGGSGGSGETIVLLKLIMPEPVSLYNQNQITVPLVLFNDGKKILTGIDLFGLVAKDGNLSNNLRITFNETNISSLKIGEKRTVNMTIDILSQEPATYEITVNATVKNPVYKDWGKMYLTMTEGDRIKEKVIFVEEFIVENPECIELKELINEAKKDYENGEFASAVKKADEALDACKNSILQKGKIKYTAREENKLYIYLSSSVIFAFVVGLLFYFYNRIKLKRGLKQ